jgi:hypothetical protein
MTFESPATNVLRHVRGPAGKGFRVRQASGFHPQRNEIFSCLVYRGEHSNAGLESIEVFR